MNVAVFSLIDLKTVNIWLCAFSALALLVGWQAVHSVIC